MIYQCKSCNWEGEENEADFSTDHDNLICPVCSDILDPKEKDETN